MNILSEIIRVVLLVALSAAFIHYVPSAAHLPIAVWMVIGFAWGVVVEWAISELRIWRRRERR